MVIINLPAIVQANLRRVRYNYQISVPDLGVFVINRGKVAALKSTLTEVHDAVLRDQHQDCDVEWHTSSGRTADIIKQPPYLDPITMRRSQTLEIDVLPKPAPKP